MRGLSVPREPRDRPIHAETASWHGLADPFDPIEAMRHSAAELREFSTDLAPLGSPRGEKENSGKSAEGTKHGRVSRSGTPRRASSTGYRQHDHRQTFPRHRTPVPAPKRAMASAMTGQPPIIINAAMATRTAEAFGDEAADARGGQTGNEQPDRHATDGQIVGPASIPCD